MRWGVAARFKRLVQLFQRQRRLLRVREPLDALLLQHLGAFCATISTRRILSPRCGVVSGDRGAALLPQPLVQRRGVLRLVLHHDLAWDVRRRVVELLEERRHDLPAAGVTRALQKEVFASGELAVAEEEDLRAGLVVGGGQRDDILVAGAGRVDDLLLLQHLLDGFDAVTQGGGPLELKVLRGGSSICRRRSVRTSSCLPSRKSITWRITPSYSARDALPTQGALQRWM